ncbi:MAG: hypothetical protein L6Q84_27955 [Polyangiaceae bacterium]|nr:hypothetical protein [Polyangiaceae bacterium]
MRTLLIAIATLALVATGCRVQASANANLNTGKKSGEEFEDEPPVKGEGEAEGPGEHALVGARHDLMLSPDKRTPVCSCLSVSLGGPADPAFKWSGAAPTIDAETQLVIAVSSEGIACPAAKPDSLGASYWGYKQAGDDVIVTIENARNGRPLTGGAIIPKPIGNGQVYVQPASKGVPYGRSLVAGEKSCKVGNPGPARKLGGPSGTQTEEEQDW